MGRATSNFFGPAPWGPGEGSKGQISFNFNYKVNFKDFLYQLCVCSHKWKIQNISDGIFILSPGSCPRGGTLGRWGAQGVIFFKHGHVVYQIHGGWWAEQNASKIFTLGSNWWPRGEVKRSNINNMLISKIFIPNFVCVLTINDRKYIEQNFHSVAKVLPWGGTAGCWGNQKL